MIEQDAKYLTNIQQTLEDNPNANQRVLAQNSNISLGQMNAVLKRCAERGWIAVKNLNMKKVCYCLTPAGLDEISRRSSGYMKRSFSMMNEYAENVLTAITAAKNEGKSKVILLGQSNIRFVIEWACERCGIGFEQIEDCDNIDADNIKADVLYFCGELAEEELAGRWKQAGALSVMEI